MLPSVSSVTARQVWSPPEPGSHTRAVYMVPARAADWGQSDGGATLDPAFRTNVIPPDHNWVICGAYLFIVYRVELRPCIRQPGFEIEYLALKS